LLKQSFLVGSREYKWASLSKIN